MAPKCKQGVTKAATKGVKKDLALKASTKESSDQKDNREDRNLNKMIQRVVNRRFWDFDENQVFCLMKGDPPTSLWDKIKATILEKKGDESRITQGLALQWRAMWCDVAKTATVTLVASVKAKVPIALKIAVGKSLLTNPGQRDRSTLYAELDATTDISESSLTKVLNSLYQANLDSGDSNAAHVVEVFEICERKGWKNKWPKHFHDTMPLLDAALARHWTLAAGAGEDALEYWNDHKTLLDPDVKDVDIQLLFKNKKNLAPHFQLLVQQCNNSQLIRRFFAVDLEKQDVIQFVTKIEGMALKHLAQQKLTKEVLLQLKEDMFQLASETTSASIGRKCKFEGTIWYGTKISWSARSKEANTYVSLQWGAVQRWFSAGNNVPLLYLERDIRSSNCNQANIFEEIEIKKIKQGRNAINRLVDQSGLKEYNSIMTHLDNRSSYLKSVCSDVETDLKLLRAFGKQFGLAAVQDKVLSILPDKGRFKSFDDVSPKMQELQESDLWQFLPADQRGPVHAAIKLVSEVAAGTLSIGKWKGLSGFSLQVGGTLQWLIQDKVRIQGKMEFATKHGMDALMAKMARIEENKGDLTKLHPHDVACCSQFKFLLPPDSLITIETLERRGQTRAKTDSMSKQPSKKQKAVETAGFTIDQLALEASKSIFSDSEEETTVEVALAAPKQPISGKLAPEAVVASTAGSSTAVSPSMAEQHDSNEKMEDDENDENEEEGQDEK